MVKKMQVKKMRWVLWVAASAGLALAVVLLVSRGNSAQSAEGPKAAMIHRLDFLLRGIPEHGDALGDPNAPVTLQFFGDLECKEARLFTLGALPFLVRRYVRSGVLRIEYRSIETDTNIPSEFRRQQVAALAAGPQGKAWYFIELFYHQQKSSFQAYATESYLEGLARQASDLNLARWNEDRRSGALAHQVAADQQLAAKRGLYLPPAFLIGPTGGPSTQIAKFSLLEPTAFEEAIEGVLRKAASKASQEV
jgi:protein-disulfide isomerase